MRKLEDLNLRQREGAYLKIAAFIATSVHTGFPSKNSQQTSLDNPVHLRK